MNQKDWEWCAEKHFRDRSNDELLEFVRKDDNCPIYRFFCVYAFLNLLDRLFGWDHRAPALVWTIVMGEIPPPDQGSWGDLGLVWLPNDPVAFLLSRGVGHAPP
jgi:hypothetical protein